MPMLLDIQRKLFARTDRIKSVDFHPSEPWVIAGLYSGSVQIYNYTTGALVKTFEVAQVPVRAVRFVARKNWFIAGSDDFQLRCYNYNTSEKVSQVEAHPDYIRCLAVHPTLSLVLTASDDMTIKLWDWDKNWKHVQTFEGHTHFIMHLAFNPKDSNTFASASIDRTVKVWTISGSGFGSSGVSAPNYTLEAHDKGVNYVEYYHGGDKPYIITCGDDKTIKVWDYFSKSCIQTLEGHVSNVSFAVFHPSLPLIISGSEDGTVKLWHSNTYRLENTLDYGLERCWCAAYRKNGNDIALGYDDGLVVVKLGKEEPSVSMDGSGKVIYARNSEVLSANLATLADDVGAAALVDGQRIAIPTREMGNTEVYAQLLQHSPNGRFVTVCGDGEYIIYTALAWRNKAFGQGTGFAWSLDSNGYAVKETNSKVKVFDRNFKERSGLLNVNYSVENVKGGALLGVLGAGFVCFYSWDTGALVRRIDVDAKDILWSGSGELVAIVTDDSFYVLRFDHGAYQDYLESGAPVDDEGVEDAFEVIVDVADQIRTAKWTDECLIYTTASNKLQYLVGEQTHTINHTDQELYLLGYIPRHGRVYAVDKDVNLYSYALSLAVVQYQTAILRQDLDAAKEILAIVPQDQLNRVARFLESQDQKELALQVSTDPDHKFDLAIALDDVDTALEITRSGPQSGSEMRWRTLGDKALERWDVSSAHECFDKAGDLNALLLLGVAKGDRSILRKVAEAATAKGQTNLAFAAHLQLGDSGACIELLEATGRISEAALFARTYAPSRVPELVKLWKASLASSKRTKQAILADSIADPSVDPGLFEEGWGEALATERDVVAAAATLQQQANGSSSAAEHDTTTPSVGAPQTDKMVNGGKASGIVDASA
ncbi:putative SEC27-coatomer complex beta subunit [Tilletiaria anomala UBC 951]|uniref:Coatomer subunit beta' n=1 Tax=Tilletiaria anomala (strain ATCC 24038 / CBS 436.72 / UBC 951) TaxID=1037660 RepID=A0A066W2P0_TILAU|nr:putative SEC27-coatomer complex beta subunit [Tilletiaria anomala UBC 951]KDN46808.1 putative SEC27-coatomer complex beta subunit [Tilletiaria anomala UBC 951]